MAASKLCNSTMTESVRLSKHLAGLTGCSRREAELYILNGWVTVDGEIIDTPQHHVSAEQTIVLHPEARAEPVPPVTLILHQPAGMTDALGLLTPQTQFADHQHHRVLNAHFKNQQFELPLPPEASGLTVCSQDWHLLRRLREKAERIEQEFLVEVGGGTAADGLPAIPARATNLPPPKVSWQNETRLRFVLKAAQPGEINQLCAATGLQVLSLKRLRLGALPLGKLPAGQWRYLHPHEKI